MLFLLCSSEKWRSTSGLINWCLRVLKCGHDPVANALSTKCFPSPCSTLGLRTDRGSSDCAVGAGLNENGWRLVATSRIYPEKKSGGKILLAEVSLGGLNFVKYLVRPSRTLVGRDLLGLCQDSEHIPRSRHPVSLNIEGGKLCDIAAWQAEVCSPSFSAFLWHCLNCHNNFTTNSSFSLERKIWKSQT